MTDERRIQAIRQRLSEIRKIGVEREIERRRPNMSRQVRDVIAEESEVLLVELIEWVLRDIFEVTP